MTVKSSACIAKDRLKIIVAHQRNGNLSLHEFLPTMKQEIISVIRRHTKIDDDQVIIQIDKSSDDISILDIDIFLPDA